MFVFFKQKTAYDMRISDWSSDVCSSDLAGTRVEKLVGGGEVCHQAGLRAEVCVGLSIRSCCDQLALIWGTEARITSRRLAANAGECHSMVEGLRDHPLRASLNAEVHSRPFARLQSPERSEEHTLNSSH